MARRLTILLLLYALTGCSREGGSLPTGSTPDPHILPLAAGTVELCRSGRTLGAQGRAGFCIPVTSGPRACFACAAGETCQCGRCAFRACAATTDCPANSRCRRGRCDPSCAGDADCPVGRECASGVCLAPCSGGCAPGEACVGGHCEATPCTEDGDCGAAQRCDLVREEASLVEPSVVRVPGLLLMALEERRPTGSVIVIARSWDGRRWEVDPEEALRATLSWEDGSVGAPALTAAPEGFVLYYEGGDGAGIGVAHAGPDARGFAPQATPLLMPILDWEAGRVGAPAPLEDGATLFYETGQAGGVPARSCASDADCGGPAGRCRAGICRPVAAAIARARFTGDEVERRLVLDPAAVVEADAGRAEGAPLWGAVSAVFSPSVAPCPTCGQPLTLLLFSGVGVELPGAPANRSVALAVARPDEAFAAYRFNPIISRLALFTQPLGESGAWALPVPGGLWVYFDGTEPSGAPAVPGVAFSPGARIVPGEGVP